MTHPILVLFVLLVFSTASIVGCSSNGAVVDTVPVVPVERTFTHGTDVVFQRAVTVLQRSGYIITVSDKAAGIITAERYSSMDQSDAPVLSNKGTSAAQSFLIFLSFVLLFGFIIMLFADSNSNAKNGSEAQKHTQKDHQRHDDREDRDTQVNSYRFVLTLRIKGQADRPSSVTATVTRVTISNGSPLRSDPVASTVITDGFFRLLTDELFFAP